jgi:hypothetical protein
MIASIFICFNRLIFLLRKKKTVANNSLTNMNILAIFQSFLVKLLQEDLFVFSLLSAVIVLILDRNIFL